jgi:hypothetical protein
MLLVAFVIVSLLQARHARPILESVVSSQITPRSDPSTRQTCDDIRECRTLWNIIWSCTATIFACTYVALHLNVPGPKESYLKKLSRKTGIMLLAVIAPELIVSWAMRQWILAQRIKNSV